MNRFLFFLLLLVVGIICLGFYLDWFHLSTRDTDEKTNITITVDKAKIEDDRERAKEKVEEMERQLKERAKH